MGWEKHLIGWFTTLAIGAVVACPAAAAKIEHFTDSRGMIHITNNAKASETNPEPAETPGPRDKNDKLKSFYERRGQQFLPPPGTESCAPPR